MARLQDRVAVVTGAGTGIGRATAVAFGREGARVVLSGRRAAPLDEAAEEVRAAGGEALAHPADVADPEAAAALVDAATAAYGRLDVLVNNAGLNVARRAMAEISVEDWRAVVDVDLTGPFLVTRAALAVMRRQGEGTVVNVSSWAGYRASDLTGPAYAAAKAALNSFTESVNLAERHRGIRACAVCPGEVATPILENRPVPPSAEARATMLQPEDLAETILLVASLPPRAAIELVVMRPTVLRDLTEDARPPG